MLQTDSDQTIRYLRQSRIAQIAVVEMCTSHLAITPAGEYRRLVEAHILQARSDGWRTGTRLRQLGERRSLARTGLDAARRMARGTTTVSRFVRTLLVAGGILHRSSDEQVTKVLLDNIRAQCAASAFALATYRALRQMAWTAGDEETARLGDVMSDHQQILLDRLLDAIDVLADPVSGAAHDTSRGGFEDAAHTRGGLPVPLRTPMRIRFPRKAVRTGEGAGSHDDKRAPADAWSEDDTAEILAGNSLLPIARYDELTAQQIVRLLLRMSRFDLTVLAIYERRHAGRGDVLATIKALQTTGLPWSDHTVVQEGPGRTRDTQATEGGRIPGHGIRVPGQRDASGSS